jgi:hypothetical protein
MSRLENLRSWFNVGAMTADLEYILFDRASGNQLGEFDTFEQAEATLLRYVAASPEAAPELEIWLEDEQLPVDPEKIRRLTVA